MKGDRAFLGPKTTGDDLPKLTLRGLALTIVTLGIYRFWYKTDLRRWYWRNTVIGGTALEYRGTARELFIGFLIALAVIMPLYGASFLLGLFIVSESIDTAMNVVIGVAFILLVQYGAFRSRRYRLTRTVWRGIRFDQSGSAGTYARKSLFWIVATLLTLGLAFPWMRRALERYRIENTHFGSAKGSFDAPVGPLTKRWLALVLPFVVILGIAVYELVASAAVEVLDQQLPVSGLGVVFLLLAMAWPFVIWPAYRAAEFRIFTTGTKIGPVSFASTFQTKRFYFLYLRLFGLCLVGLLALGLFVAIIGWVLGPALVRRFGASVAAMALIPPYIIGFFMISWIKEVVFNQGFWRHGIDRLTIFNLAAADEVLGGGILDEPATGEGFADALEFGGV